MHRVESVVERRCCCGGCGTLIHCKKGGEGKAAGQTAQHRSEEHRLARSVIPTVADKRLSVLLLLRCETAETAKGRINKGSRTLSHRW